MESKELRIGNYVRNEELTIIKIEDGFDIDMSKWYEPIELTEEILFNIKGIKRYNDISFKLNSEYVVEYLIDTWSVRKIIDIENSTFINNTHFLHKLQNLYWCLTNEELEINL